MEKIREFNELRKESLGIGRGGMFRSIRMKVNMAVSISGLLLMLFNLWLLTDSMNFVKRDLTNDRLSTDLCYLREVLGASDAGAWSVRGGVLYCGEMPIGDGSEENAYTEPLTGCYRVTGASYTVFLCTGEDDPAKRYLRVSSTVAGENGVSAAGTPMGGKTAERLDAAGDVYFSEVNAGGTQYFCRYERLKDENGNTIGILTAGRSAEMTESLIHKQKIRGFILIIFAMVLMSAGLSIVVYTMLGAIRKIRTRLAEIGTGVFPEEPLHIDTHDELADVADSVNEMVDSLREKERIGAELSLATDIQAHMLPSIFPPFPEYGEFDIYATMDPAKEVGGDFYDFFMLDEKTLAFLIADVSGKGVPAALFMVIAKTLIKNHTQMGLPPAEVFTTVNQMLCEGNEAELFVTAWMGVLDIETGHLEYVNAGHNPPLLRKGGGAYTYLKTRPCFVLAGMEGVRYRQDSAELAPGDRIFLYTDGVTEATSAAQELYGEERLMAYLNAHPDEGGQKLLEGLRADMDEFVGDAAQFDDITMLSLEYKKYRDASAMTERIFDADDSQLPCVTAFLEEELEKNACPMKAAMQIQIAAEEIFVNVAHYAYEDCEGSYAGDGRNGREKNVKIGILVKDGWAELRFTDRGMPFDPLAKKDPDITLSAEDRSVGGLGIFMVKKTMDDVRYTYENGRNILTVRKKL